MACAVQFRDRKDGHAIVRSIQGVGDVHTARALAPRVVLQQRSARNVCRTIDHEQHVLGGDSRAHSPCLTRCLHGCSENLEMANACIFVFDFLAVDELLLHHQVVNL